MTPFTDEDSSPTARFSDADLKRLKEWAMDMSDKTIPDRREIVPLLHRLECAENLITAWKEYDNSQGDASESRWLKSCQEAWRQSTGRE